MRQTITVNRRSRNAADRIRAALAAGEHVMGKTPIGWFRMVEFRETPAGDGVIWEGMTADKGRLSARPGFLAITSASWLR